MRQLLLTISSLLLLLTLGNVLFVSVVAFDHSQIEIAHHGSNCPFMNHEESLCPMSVFDHLSVLRTIFESVLPGLATISLTLPVLLIFYPFLLKTRAPVKLKSYTQFKQRLYLLNNYYYKLHQALFARGILNPKLF